MMSKEEKHKKKDEQDEQVVKKQENSDPANDKDDAHDKKDKKKKTDHTEEVNSQWQAKYDEMNDKYLRLYSEFDNYRKRTIKEKIEFSKTASEEVILSLLPVIDDLERALASAFTSDGEKEVVTKDGVQLIYQKFKGLLIQKGLEVIPSVGEVFNVDYHDALTNIPAPSEEMKGKVVDEIEKGYKLNGKVIRYSKVVVGN